MVKSLLVDGLNMCRQSLNNTKGCREPAEYFTKKSSLEYGQCWSANPLDVLFPVYNARPSILYPVVYPLRSSSNVSLL